MPSDRRGVGDSIRPRMSCAVLLAAFAVLLAARLVLSADEGIVSEPDDAVIYATMTQAIGEARLGLFRYRPGFPAVAALVASTGIPYRVGIEVLYLVSCFLFAHALQRSSRSVALGVATLFLMAGHPWTLQAFRHFHSEPTLLCASLVTFAAMLGLLDRERLEISDPLLWMTGISLSFSSTVRNEDVILLSTYGSFALLAVFGQRRRSRRESVRALLLLSVPVALLLASQLALKAVNAATVGVFAMSRTEAPGFLALLHALFRIGTPEGRRHAPFGVGSLRAAVTVSPTLGAYARPLFHSIARETAV